MPKAPSTRRQSRPSGPYNLRPSPANPADPMGDFMIPQHSPAWPNPHYGHHYPPPPLSMTSMPDYMHSMGTPAMSASAMPTPSIPHQQTRASRHSSHPSQSTPWTSEEDNILLEAKRNGLAWPAIHEKYFPGKTGNACRKRHERLLAKKRGTEWNDDRLEKLAVAYKEMRSQIWTPLATSVGEKWEHVEKICMQEGVKTLTNRAAKHARHHSSGHSRYHSSSGSSNHRVSNEYERSSADELDDSGFAESIGLGVGGVRHTRRQSLQPSATSLDNILHRSSHQSYVYQ